MNQSGSFQLAPLDQPGKRPSRFAINMRPHTPQKTFQGSTGSMPSSETLETEKMLPVRCVRSHKPSAKGPLSQLAYPAPASLSKTISPSLPTQLGHNSVSIGLGERPGTNTAPIVQISTSTVCATPEIMTQLLVRDASDPMKVSTPLRIDGLEGGLKERWAQARL